MDNMRRLVSMQIAVVLGVIGVFYGAQFLEVREPHFVVLFVPLIGVVGFRFLFGGIEKTAVAISFVITFYIGMAINIATFSHPRLPPVVSWILSGYIVLLVLGSSGNFAEEFRLKSSWVLGTLVVGASAAYGVLGVGGAEGLVVAVGGLLLLVTIDVLIKRRIVHPEREVV